nr:hypothetical protein [Tanacetum cinerariifolium]
MNMGQDRQMQMVRGNGENQFRQYVGQNVSNLNGYNAVQNVRNQVAQNLRVQNVGNQNGLICVLGNANLNWNGNLVAARAEGNATRQNGNQIRCYNYRGVGHFVRNCTVRPRRRDAADLDEIEEVNANCILMENLQQASTSGTQTDKAPERYTELLEPIPEPHQVPQNDHNVISEVTSVEQSGETVEQHSVNFKETQKKKLKYDFKIREDELLDKQIQLKKKIKELNNILVKMGQSIQTIHMLSPKPDSFYHTEQKMALGYQIPFYLKQAQKMLALLFSEAGVLHVNWISYGYCIASRGHLC